LFTFATRSEEYLEIDTGMPKEAYPTLLGVDLYETQDPKEWTTYIFPFEKNIAMSLLPGNQRKHETFTFRRVLRPIHPGSLKESPFLIDCLVKWTRYSLCDSYDLW
jgi:hypothetical protein